MCVSKRNIIITRERANLHVRDESENEKLIPWESLQISRTLDLFCVFINKDC